MTRSIIHLTSEAQAGDEIRVEYAYFDPNPVVIPPWWADIVCSPEPWGRPVSASIIKSQVKTSPDTYRYYMTINVTIEVQAGIDPNTGIGMGAIWSWPQGGVVVTNPAGYSTEVNYHGAGWEWISNTLGEGYAFPDGTYWGDRNPGPDFTWTGGPTTWSASLTVDIGGVGRGAVVVQDEYLEQANAQNYPLVEPIGFTISRGYPQNQRIYAGASDVCAGRYYCGSRVVRLTLDPSDTNGVTDPYLVV